MLSGTPKRSRHIIHSFEAKALKKRSLSVRFADTLTSFFGTFTFLMINVIVFSLWILINLNYLPGIPAFDPFPFVLLTTSVSLEAIILTTIVMMSQSRQSTISALREEMQLQVNFASEREITKVLKLLNLLIKKNNLAVEDDPELDEMLKDLDASFIEKQLEEQINPKQENPFGMVARPVEKIGKVVEGTLPFKKQNRT